MVMFLRKDSVNMMVSVSLTVSVSVVEGAATVIVSAVTPMHEHALEYRAGLLSQAVAYKGRLDGTTVTWRFNTVCPGGPSVTVVVEVGA